MTENITRIYHGDQRRLRYMVLRSRAQARYWRQGWHLTWEQYQEILTQIPIDLIGRQPHQYNLIRQNKRRGWSPDNCQMQLRSETVYRPRLRDQQGRLIRRRRRRDA